MAGREGSMGRRPGGCGGRLWDWRGRRRGGIGGSSCAGIPCRGGRRRRLILGYGGAGQEQDGDKAGNDRAHDGLLGVSLAVKQKSRKRCFRLFVFWCCRFQCRLTGVSSFSTAAP